MKDSDHLHYPSVAPLSPMRLPTAAQLGPRLKMLDLGGNVHIRDAGAQALASGLASNTALKVLKVGNSKQEGLIALAHAGWCVTAARARDGGGSLGGGDLVLRKHGPEECTQRY